LKKISDSQAAFFVADKLASQIESECEGAIARLFNSLETQAEDVFADDVQKSTEKKDDWLFEFEREMRSGLEKWNQAEEDFLRARSEWESQAESLYAKDLQKWQEARQILQERKEAWTKKISDQIKSGELEWQKKIDSLEEEMSDFMKDFEMSVAFENEQKKQLSLSSIQAYEQSRSILQSAQKGVDNWYARWTQKYNGLYSYWKSEDSEFGREHDLAFVSVNDLKNEIQKWKKDYVAALKDFSNKALSEFNIRTFICQGNFPYTLQFLILAQNQFSSVMSISENSSAQEIESACSVINAYKGWLGEDSANAAFWNSVSLGGALWRAPQELYEWLSLFDKFSDKARNYLDLLGGASLDFDFYEDLSVEKTGLASFLELWEERVRVADAVYEYSKNVYSDLDSAAMTEEKVQKKLSAFNEAKELYQKQFSLANQASSEVEIARENYFSSIQKTCDLLTAWDDAKREYDFLQNELNGLQKNLFSLDDLYDLNARIIEVNVEEKDFINLLFAFCEKKNEPSKKLFEDSASAIRDKIENGSDEISFDSARLDGYELDESVMKEKESLASINEKSSKTLSIKRLEEIIEGMETVLFSHVFDKDLLESLVPDLLVACKEETETLNEKYLNSENFDSNDSECRDLLKLIKGRVEKQLENKRAALLLLDGNAKEIHDFFDNNADFDSIYQEYKDYSKALLDESNKNALSALCQLLRDMEGKSGSECLAALDDASFGLNEGQSALLSLYKESLQSKMKYEGVEDDLQKCLLGIFGNSFDVKVEKILYRPELFEECFYSLKDEASENFADFDMETFNKIFEGQKKIPLEIIEKIDVLRNPSAKRMELERQTVLQKEKVEGAKNEYEKSLDASSGLSPDSAINIFSLSAQKYNSFLEESSRLYEKLKEARFNYLYAQEIYFYGQNEYLREDYNALQKLEKAVKKRDLIKNELDALNKIQKDKSFDEAESYKNSFEQYYKSKSLLYKYEKALILQKDRLFMAQEEERKAVQAIVCEAFDKVDDYSVPASVLDLLSVQKNDDGSYSFCLKNNFAQKGNEKENLFKEYFTEQTFVQTDVYGNEYASSKAKHDALEFLDSLDSKPYTIIDLSLAAMAYKSLGDAYSRARWFDYGEDPSIDQNYKIGDLPDIVHVVNLTESYRNGRMDVLCQSFNKVMALGGEEDLAKCILYSNQNFSPDLGISDIKNWTLRSLALNKPADEVGEAADNWQMGADVSLITAAVFKGIACIPIVGSWALPFAKTFTIIGTALKIIASKLFEAERDIRVIQIGNIENMNSGLNNFEKLFTDLNESRKKTRLESEKLNVLVSGSENGDNSPLTWTKFNNALKSLFANDSSGSLKDYFYSMADSSQGQKSLKELYESVSKDEKFFDVTSALNKMSALLKESLDSKKNDLSVCLAAKEKNPSFDKGAYYKDMLSFYANKMLRPLPVNLGSEIEGYQLELFSIYQELKEETLLNSGINRVEAKRKEFAALLLDLQEQMNSWNEKCDLILSSAKKEWEASEEKILSEKKLWEKNWSLEYSGLNQEWENNYKDFLESKKEWIYKQYIGAASDEPKMPLSAMTGNLKDFFPKESIDNYLSHLNDSGKFERFSRMTENLADFVRDVDFGNGLFLLDKIDSSIINDFDASLKTQRDLQKEMQIAAAKCALQEFRNELENGIDSYFSAIEKQNKKVEKWELDMVRGSGYSVDPMIHRSAVVGSSYFGTKRETQWVHRYQYFTAQGPEVQLEYSDCAEDDSHALMKKMEAMKERVQSWANEIFGNASDSNRGKLSEHIGEAPVFVKNPDARRSLSHNVEKYGSGQMGLIMLDFQWNAIQNSEGYAELSKSLYDHKIIDTGVKNFNLPTIRDLTGAAFDIAATVPMFQFLSCVDDILFGAVDVGMGYKTWQEALNDVAKKSVFSFASGTLGLVAGALGETIKMSWKCLAKEMSKTLFDAAQKTALGYVNHVGSSYINAFDFASGKMNWEEAADSWLSASALTSAFGTFLGGSLNLTNNFDA
nr:hypothetical protein [Treponema sp.]